MNRLNPLPEDDLIMLDAIFARAVDSGYFAKRINELSDCLATSGLVEKIFRDDNAGKSVTVFNHQGSQMVLGLKAIAATGPLTKMDVVFLWVLLTTNEHEFL